MSNTITHLGKYYCCKFVEQDGKYYLQMELGPEDENADCETPNDQTTDSNESNSMKYVSIDKVYDMDGILKPSLSNEMINDLLKLVKDNQTFRIKWEEDHVAYSKPNPFFNTLNELLEKIKNTNQQIGGFGDAIKEIQENKNNLPDQQIQEQITAQFEEYNKNLEAFNKNYQELTAEMKEENSKLKEEMETTKKSMEKVTQVHEGLKNSILDGFKNEIEILKNDLNNLSDAQKGNIIQQIMQQVNQKTDEKINERMENQDQQINDEIQKIVQETLKKEIEEVKKSQGSQTSQPPLESSQNIDVESMKKEMTELFENKMEENIKIILANEQKSNNEKFDQYYDWTTKTLEAQQEYIDSINNIIHQNVESNHQNMEQLFSKLDALEKNSETIQLFTNQIAALKNDMTQVKDDLNFLDQQQQKQQERIEDVALNVDNLESNIKNLNDRIEDVASNVDILEDDIKNLKKEMFLYNELDREGQNKINTSLQTQIDDMKKTMKNIIIEGRNAILQLYCGLLINHYLYLSVANNLPESPKFDQNLNILNELSGSEDIKTEDVGNIVNDLNKLDQLNKPNVNNDVGNEVESDLEIIENNAESINKTANDDNVSLDVLQKDFSRVQGKFSNMKQKLQKTDQKTTERINNLDDDKKNKFKNNKQNIRPPNPPMNFNRKTEPTGTNVPKSNRNYNANPNTNTNTFFDRIPKGGEEKEEIQKEQSKEKEGGESKSNSDTLQMLIQTNQLLEKLLFQSKNTL